MLGILPYDRFTQQRDQPMDRPFKTYQRPSPQMTSLQSPYYASFANPSYMRAVDLRHQDTSSYMRAVDLRHQDTSSYMRAVDLRHQDTSDAAASVASKMDYHRFSSQYNPQPYHSGHPTSFGYYGGSGPSIPPHHPAHHTPSTLVNFFDPSPQPMSMRSSATILKEEKSSTEKHCNTLGSSLALDPTRNSNFSPPSLASDSIERHYRGATALPQEARTGTSTAVSTASSSLDEISSPDSSRRASDVTKRAACTSSARVGSLSDPAPRSRSKRRPTAVPADLKDKQYWDKRKKNNDSAKRSREARRRQESMLSKHLTNLEQEYVQLKADIAVFSNEIEQIRQYLMPNSFEQSGPVEQIHHHHHHVGLL